MKTCNTCKEKLSLIAFNKKNAPDCLLCKLKRRYERTLWKIENTETLSVDELDDMLVVGFLGAKTNVYLPKEYLLEKYTLEEIFPLRNDMVLVKPIILDKYSSIMTIEEVKREANYTCAYCGELASTVDHWIPRTKGGTWDKVNLVASCYECNIAKGDAVFENIDSAKEYIKMEKALLEKRKKIKQRNKILEEKRQLRKQSIIN